MPRICTRLGLMPSAINVSDIAPMLSACSGMNKASIWSPRAAIFFTGVAACRRREMLDREHPHVAPGGLRLELGLGETAVIAVGISAATDFLPLAAAKSMMRST